MLQFMELQRVDVVVQSLSCVQFSGWTGTWQVTVPTRVRQLRSRNGFGEWQCDNDTGTWEDLELWSQLRDSFREMKHKLFGEYFSLGRDEVPEVGVRGQCQSAPLSSPPPASRRKKEKAATQYLIFRIN